MEICFRNGLLRSYSLIESKGTELANDDVLGGRFEGQRHHNPLDVVPFLSDQLGVELAHRFEHHLVTAIVTMP